MKTALSWTALALCTVAGCLFIAAQFYVALRT